MFVCLFDLIGCLSASASVCVSVIVSACLSAFVCLFGPQPFQMRAGVSPTARTPKCNSYVVSKIGDIKTWWFILGFSLNPFQKGHPRKNPHARTHTHTHIGSIPRSCLAIGIELRMQAQLVGVGGEKLNLAVRLLQIRFLCCLAPISWARFSEPGNKDASVASMAHSLWMPTVSKGPWLPADKWPGQKPPGFREKREPSI